MQDIRITSQNFSDGPHVAEHVLNVLNDFAAQSRDQTVKLEELLYSAESDSLILRVPNESEEEGAPPYNWNPIVVDIHAETQLLQRLAIPAGYFHRCPASLKAMNMNYWLARQANKSVVLRWHGNQGVRGIVSPRYNTDLDDDKVFPLILAAESTAWDSAKENVYFSLTKSPVLTKALIMFEDAKVEYEGVTYSAGVCVVNSEVGSSALYIRPVIHSSSGYNYLDSSLEGVVGIMHTTQLVTGTTLIDALVRAREVAEVGIHQLLLSGKIQIEKPREEIRTLVATHPELPAMLVQYIEDKYAEDQRITRLELVRDILEAVRDLPVYKVHQVELQVGRYLDLFTDTEVRLQSIMEDLE